MRILVLAILIIGMMSNCTKKNITTNKTNIVLNSGYPKIEITKIEGCEYFVQYTYYGYYVLTHKGNCSNSIHKK